VEVAVRSAVSEFYETPTGKALVDATWQLVPMVPNANMTIEQSNGAAGDRYDTDFSVGLRTPFGVKELCLVRITFSDGTDPMLIGSMDFPVKLREQHNLRSKTFSFAHSSWHYPFRADSIAGSSDPGSSYGGL
tara:strand:+ start:7673 stop:8071 length:399 start_codon:yes stop_codon:yes gene_type:complete